MWALPQEIVICIEDRNHTVGLAAVFVVVALPVAVYRKEVSKRK